MQTFQLDSRPHDLAFAPDGRLLVVSNWCVLLDTLGSEPPRLLKPPTGDFTAYPQLALDGRVLIYARPGDDTHLHAWNLETDQITHWKDAAKHVIDLAVSPDGKTLYAAYEDRRDWNGNTGIRVFDVATGALKSHIPECKDIFRWLSISGDGTRLAGRGSYATCVWDLTALKVLTTLVLGKIGNYVGAVALSANGMQLATITTRAVALRDISNGEAVREIFRSGKHKCRATHIACNPQKPVLASSDTNGQIFLWDHAGNVLTRYDWGLDGVQGICFAPDGLRCAAVDAKGKAVVWDVDV